jgi:hypothetical protein
VPAAQKQPSAYNKTAQNEIKLKIDERVENNCVGTPKRKMSSRRNSVGSNRSDLSQGSKPSRYAREQAAGQTRNTQKSLQQSHSAFDILRNNYANNLDSEVCKTERLADRIQEIQAGENWSCMWLNHFNREQEQINRRTEKYQNNTNMIISNPTKFGLGKGNISESKKSLLQSMQLEGGHGNEFVEHMSGCPIQKVHKLRSKKREKLTKYLLKHPEQHVSYRNKNKLQNGNGVGLETTPDYNYYKVLSNKKSSFKDDVMRQLSANRRKAENDRKINRESDIRTSQLYEKKMQIVEHLQQANRERMKKSLRDDINWQIKQKMSRSFYN